MSSFLVTGVGGPAGQSVTALLLARGHRVIGTDIRELTRESIKFFLVPPAKNPEFLSSIYTIASREQVDEIIPTVSEELPVFAEGWKWRDAFPLLLPSSQAIRIANDKYLTASVLSEHKVSIPRFALPSQVSSADEVQQIIGWPCIGKPRVGRGGRDVILYSKQDWSQIQLLGDRYILQEFAEGVDYAPNVFLGKDGEAVVVVIEKTELKQGIVGNAASAKRVDSPDVAELAVAAARAIHLVGPADIDIRRRKDGTPVVLEINARFGANIWLAPEVLEAALDMKTSPANS